MPRPCVVMLSPVLPYDAIPHAGGGFVRRLIALLDRETELTLIVPNTPVNRAARDQPGAPPAVLVGGEHDGTPASKARAAATATLDAWARRADPGTASRVLAAGLRRPGPAREALAAADVVDLQWSEVIGLARTVRRLAPGARLLGTFHDVQSQLFEREPARHGLDPLYWRAAAAQARRHEKRAVQRLDEVLVFSAKDATLLGATGHARVVLPPLATGHELTTGQVAVTPTVLFVAHFARPENDQAARWLLTEIWPSVVARCPDARLRLVGSGVAPKLAALVADRPGAAAAGFVRDLEPEYAAARCCVVPMRHGAGVKFKTVEALLHGVPTVTTPVGAEGIDGPDLFAGLSSLAPDLADQVVDVLLDPAAHQARSAAAQAWASDAYGADQFATAVRSAYGIDAPS